MNLSDTFYIALCMTVLILGVVYWFWTQNQFILRKLNLLENIVYEMKSALPSSPDNGVGAALSAAAAAAAAAAASTSNAATPAVYSAPIDLGDLDDDLLHDDLSDEFATLHHAPMTLSSPPSPSKKVEAVAADDDIQEEHKVPGGTYGFLTEDIGVGGSSEDDLQPGGIGSGIQGPDEPDATAKGAVLDGMTLKELRRLAEQKGLNLPKSARKQELIDAIRAAKATITPFDISEGKTLDFTM